MPRRDTNPLDSGPASDAFAITANVAFPTGYSSARGLYVGGAGDVVLTTLQGNQRTFTAVPAGTILPQGCISVDSGTTASAILGLV